MTTPATEAPSRPLSRAVVEAVQRAALHAGVYMPDGTAEVIARAAIEQADDVYRVRQVIDGEMWEREDVRDSVRRHQHRQIFVDLADKGMVPVAWPQERVYRERWFGGCEMVTVERFAPARVVRVVVP